MGHHVVHHRTRLADAEAADGIAVEADVLQSLRAHVSQRLVDAALHDAEKSPLTLVCRGVAALRPAPGQLHGQPRGVVGDGVGSAFVEGHHDVGAEGQLDVDGALRGEQVPRAVHVGLEGHAILGNARQIAQAEDLEAAAVGEDGQAPAHEVVQPAETADEFVAGPQVEVIGVAEDDRGAAVEQVAGTQGLYGCLRAHRHEHGRVDDAVRRFQAPEAGLAAGVASKDIKRQRHGQVSDPT